MHTCVQESWTAKRCHPSQEASGTGTYKLNGPSQSVHSKALVEGRRAEEVGVEVFVDSAGDALVAVDEPVVTEREPRAVVR